MVAEVKHMSFAEVKIHCHNSGGKILEYEIKREVKSSRRLGNRVKRTLGVLG